MGEFRTGQELGELTQSGLEVDTTTQLDVSSSAQTESSEIQLVSPAHLERQRYHESAQLGQVNSAFILCKESARSTGECWDTHHLYINSRCTK